MSEMDFYAVDLRIRELIKRDRLPNVSVCVLGPDGIVFEKGYGYRDKDFIHPVDPDTVFGIASMSKSMTALAIAILECEGKLSYDDPVTRYFPNFSVPGAPEDMVTLRPLARIRQSAIRVLPTPGGPYSKSPRGGTAPSAAQGAPSRRASAMYARSRLTAP